MSSMGHLAKSEHTFIVIVLFKEVPQLPFCPQQSNLSVDECFPQNAEVFSFQSASATSCECLPGLWVLPVNVHHIGRSIRQTALVDVRKLILDCFSDTSVVGFKNFFGNCTLLLFTGCTERKMSVAASFPIACHNTATTLERSAPGSGTLVFASCIASLWEGM